MSKISLSPNIKLNWYSILEKEIENGIHSGYRRAFKHTNHPDEDYIKEQILAAIMNNVCEIIQEKE